MEEWAGDCRFVQIADCEALRQKDGGGMRADVEQERL
jgi:hypothetical protein